MSYYLGLGLAPILIRGQVDRPISDLVMIIIVVFILTKASAFFSVGMSNNGASGTRALSLPPPAIQSM